MKHPAKPAVPAKPIRFMPLEVTAKSRADDSDSVEIFLREGRVVRVRPGFDRQTLAAVLAVLEARAC
jgi:transposase